MYSTISNFSKIFHKKYLCKAPFNSIYISGDGSVTTCCFNRTDILGNIYDSPLIDIINNPKIIDLRKKIENGIFPNGCKICKNHLKNGNKANSGITTFENFPVLKNSLSIIEFELSYKCNIKCTMCKRNENHLNINPEKIGFKKFNLIEQITPFIDNIKLMRFYGGEPFFIEEYYSIWEHVIAVNPKCKFLIQTNGTILNSRIENLIMKGNFSYNISIDSINKNSYEIIRKGADFEITMQNLKKLKQIAVLKHESISISLCPMRINWKEIPEILEFCNKNKFLIFFNSVFSPWNMALWSLSYNELIEIYNYYKTIKFRTNSKVSIINKFRWNSFIKQIHNWSIIAKHRPQLSNKEINEFKIEIFNIIKNKTLEFANQKNIKIDYILQKEKINSSLDEIFKFIPFSTLIEKLNSSSSETIYNEVINKDEFEIKDNIIRF